MTIHIHNLEELSDAIARINKAEPELSHVLVFIDTNDQTYRFVVGRYGLAKQDSDKQGNEIH